MARINVFLRDELLKAVEAEVAQTGTNRSALIQAALAKYLELRRKEREEAEVQRRLDEACSRMDALADKLGPWDPTNVIRQFRDSRYRPARGGPARVRERRRR